MRLVIQLQPVAAPVHAERARAAAIQHFAVIQSEAQREARCILILAFFLGVTTLFRDHGLAMVGVGNGERFLDDMHREAAGRIIDRAALVFDIGFDRFGHVDHRMRMRIELLARRHEAGLDHLVGIWLDQVSAVAGPDFEIVGGRLCGDEMARLLRLYLHGERQRNAGKGESFHHALFDF